jgi:hypothetical protein
MRPYVCAALAGVIAVSVAGCGLDKDGIGSTTTTLEDGGTTVLPTPTVDGSVGGGGQADGAPGQHDAGPIGTDDATPPPSPLDDAASPPIDSAPPPPGDTGVSTPCVAAVPDGWSLVGYEQAQNDCPDGYGDAHDEYSGATAAPGACTCTCQITTAPSCTAGTIATSFGTLGAACPTPGEPFTVTSSGCTALPQAGTLALNFQGSAIALSGGACAGAAQTASNQLTKNGVRYCDVAASNAESVCEGAAGPGFAACIVADGDLACPPGSPFTKKTTVADDESLTCSACGTCAVTGTCAKPTLTFYSDAACSAQVTQVASDGTCVPSNAAGKSVAAAEYTAETNASCAASGSTASVSPKGAHTLCCR